MLERSAIILAGGSSERFGQCKAFVKLIEKPLILHVFEKIQKLVDEVLVVISSTDHADSFSLMFDTQAKIISDNGVTRAPLLGAVKGFENALGKYSVLLPCDTPFLSKEVLSLLFDICIGVDSVIPKWPNGYIEPLHAVYRTSSAAQAAKLTLLNGKADMRSMISLLKKVRYISTIALKWLDPDLNTFFNVNTRQDLKRAEQILSKTLK